MAQTGKEGSSGWSVEVWDDFTQRSGQWHNGAMIAFAPGKVRHIRIIVKEINGATHQPITYTLNFISMTTGRKTKLG